MINYLVINNKSHLNLIYKSKEGKCNLKILEAFEISSEIAFYSFKSLDFFYDEATSLTLILIVPTPVFE